MRTIRFRGKDKKSQQWVYGDLELNENGLGEVVSAKILTHNYVKSFVGGGFDSFVVSTPINCDTIGQFTGLLDKNGKEIYEGDIVEFVDINLPDCVIVYDNGSFMYRELGEDISTEELRIQFTVEVIGNIHDNPELLE